MDPALGVALINGVFGVLILVGGIVLNSRIKVVGQDVDRVTKTVDETKNEVKNSHTINFRDDIDSKFKITNSLIESVQESQDRQGREIIGLRNIVSNHIETEAHKDAEIREELIAFRKTLKREVTD